MAKRSTEKSETGRVSLGGVSVSALQRELQRRSGKAATLRRQRDRLLAKVAKLDAKIRSMGGDVGPVRVGRGGRRPAGEGTLASSLAAVLKGKTMGVTEAAEAVQASGYKTGAANFRTIVNACLIKHTDLFKKLGRGKYTAA